MATITGFLKSFGKEKFEQVKQGFAEVIVNWDPETATQAEIEEMIKELDKITVEAGKARQDFDKERAEAEAARDNFNKHLKAAEILNLQYEAAAAGGQESADAKALKASLDKLIADLEKMEPEVKREEKEAAEAKEYYDEVKNVAEMTAEKVRSARATLESAQREVKRAKIEEERAAARAEKAERLAGLRKGTDGMGIALKAMQNQAAEARAAAEASSMKATLLDNKGGDSNIEAALKQASGGAAPTASISDRLAALKKS
jgi:chromosome segregation ATPase